MYRKRCLPVSTECSSDHAEQLIDHHLLSEMSCGTTYNDMQRKLVGPCPVLHRHIVDFSRGLVLVGLDAPGGFASTCDSTVAAIGEVPCTNLASGLECTVTHLTYCVFVCPMVSISCESDVLNLVTTFDSIPRTQALLSARPWLASVGCTGS